DGDVELADNGASLHCVSPTPEQCRTRRRRGHGRSHATAGRPRGSPARHADRARSLRFASRMTAGWLPPSPISVPIAARSSARRVLAGARRASFAAIWSAVRSLSAGATKVVFFIALTLELDFMVVNQVYAGIL